MSKTQDKNVSETLAVVVMAAVVAPVLAMIAILVFCAVSGYL